ncbi:Uncharacterised protein [Segatella copri]|nr:Uncharacterised protein [Segatella copri]
MLILLVILIILLHFNTLLKRCKTVNNQQIYNRFFYFILILFLAERIASYRRISFIDFWESVAEKSPHHSGSILQTKPCMDSYNTFWMQHNF